MPRTALFPGSFDPVTNGHLDLVRQAARFADRLVLAIGIHPGKTTLFSADERLAMLRETCAPIAQAGGCDFECVTFAGLVVAAAQREGATLLVRGLRSATDFDYEMEMAGMTNDLFAGLADGPPDHRHTGAPDRFHGRRRIEFRSTSCGSSPQGKIRPHPGGVKQRRLGSSSYRGAAAVNSPTSKGKR
jgi:pantetheine-phosphate adenylyltransferase